MKKGWEIKKLGEICDVITKGTTPTSLGFQFIDRGVNFIKVESLTESGKIIPNKVAYISEECHETLKRSQLRVNDILFSIAGALGRIGIVNNEIVPANTNQALAIVRLAKDSGILVSFLAKYFTSNKILKEIEKLRGGAAQQNLSLGQLNNLSILLPPLPEQQRIVSILDEAFAAIAKAKANAEQNLKNAKELFENTKSQIFKNLEDVEDKVSLASVCNELFAGGDAPKGKFSIEKNEKHKIPIIANAVKDSGLYGYTDISRVNKPSITIAARGSGTGHTEIRHEPFFPIVRLIVLTPNVEMITLEFLKFSVQNLDILSSGSAIPQLTIPMIKEYSIPLPSISKQHVIVQKLDTLSVETKKLETIYRQKLHDLEELKKSILQKAFSGELSVGVNAPISIESPAIIQNVSITDLHAGIIAIAFQRHQEKEMAHTLHHVKSEKIIHMAESFLGIQLNRNPVKDAAGPNDFPRTKVVESRAKKAGFFTVEKQDKLYVYKAGSQIDTLIDKVKSSLSDKADDLIRLIDLMLPMTTQQAEIFATVFAAWNNLLIDNKPVSDEAIVFEARENWHKDKLKIPREKFSNAITWMKEKNIVPKGNGRKVVSKQNKT